ncbi:MAG: cellulase family glycosylhydrolase, partial [Bacillota bacterium]|nr:cellulase family glycosylhydrolase [Bacillota bacterium]
MEKDYMALHVEGNQIKNEKGESVRLLGLNRAGLEWESEDSRIISSVAAACDEWHANIIRVPLSQDRWFGHGPEQKGRDDQGMEYRQLVDKVVEEIFSRGKYVLLELHWSNCGQWGKYIGQHYMPDMNSVEFWKDAAERYKSHSAVLFGVYNEPHSVSWDIWRNGGSVTETFDYKKGKYTEDYETPGIQALADVIRSTGAKNIMVIGGLDWAFILDGIAKGYAIEDKGVNGIIYDSHVYPWKTVDWDEAVTVIADKYPILIGELGHYGDDAKPVEG